MRDHGDRQRPDWPIDTRLSMSDVFEMIEAFNRDPSGFGPELREALANDTYRRHHEAQIAATVTEKPTRRGR
jgi:hypothetical protein